MTTNPFQSDFLEHRRSGLEAFMKKVVEHPGLGTCEDVVMFLEEQGGEFVGPARPVVFRAARLAPRSEPWILGFSPSVRRRRRGARARGWKVS